MVYANAPMKLDRTEVSQGESRCLSESSTRIIINGLVFNFIFTITNEAEERDYLEQRDRVLRETDGLSVPDTKTSGIPFKSDIRFPSVVFRDQLGQGKFGAVFHGVEPQTGDIRVIKRLHLLNDRDIQLARHEVKALDEVQSSLGIVRKYDIRNGKGEDRIPSSAPSDLYIVQERGIPFRERSEPPETPQNRALLLKTRASLMYQLLAGLEAIHRKHWLHRDITRNNLLYFDEDTPRAALCDFGKVCFENTSRDSYIANQVFLPPGIIPGGTSPYTYSLDVFILGLALAQQWFYEAATRVSKTASQGRREFLIPRYEDQHIELLNNPRGLTGSSIAPLLIQMLGRLATGRPTATELLDDSDLAEYIPSATLNAFRARRQNT